MRLPPIPITLAALLLLTVPPGHAATDRQVTHGAWCGTHGSLLVEKMAQNSQSQSRLTRENLRSFGASEEGFAATAAGAPKVRQVKQIAVIEDDGSLVAKPNPFDLPNSALEFKRRKKKIRAVVSGGGVSPERGDRIVLGDDDSFEVNLPFSFKMFGKKHREMFINSDGNLTFGLPDSASSARDIARVLTGPPRISPFFSDLDPSRASGERGVFLRVTDSSVRITWNEIPEFGGSKSNTFQVTLYSTGRILMTWGKVATREAIVGVSPGGSSPLELLDFSQDLPFGPDKAAILERFGTSQQVDDLGVAQTFLKHFKDDYDHVIVWLDFRNQLGGGTFAYEFTLRNKIRGIGEPIYDASAAAGSNGRLEAFVQMGTLARYSTNKSKKALATLTSLDLLGHEAGHRWMSFTKFRDSQGRASSALLGRGQAHWSFYFDTDASVMEGNDIQDNGDGTFTTVAATDQYSRVDRYLMGLIPPESVGEFFYLSSPAGPDPSSQPAVGETIRGHREDLAIEDIIDVEGNRRPGADTAKKTFKMAFILLGRKGEPPSQASIDKLDTIRDQWISYFKKATGNKGKVVTKLEPK